MQEEERDIAPELLSGLFRESKKLSKNFADRYRRLKPAAEYIRGILEERSQRGESVGILKRVRNCEREIVAYAIDTSFLASPLNLVYGDLVLFTAGYIRFPRHPDGGHNVNRMLKVKLDLVARGFVTSYRLSVRSHIFERKLALELLEKKSSGEVGFDFNAIFIDGPILPLPLPPPRRNKTGELIDITEDVVSKAKELGVTVVGVVKRVRSRMLARAFLSGDPEYADVAEEANDKAIGILMLRRGEYVKFGRLGGPLALRGVSQSEEAAQRAADFVKERPWVGDIEVFLMKPENSEQPIGVEILDYGGLGSECVLGWISQHSSYTGCPHFLDAVDSFVKIEPSLVEVARRVLIRHAIEEIGEPEVIDLLEHADLQNKFSPRRMG